MTKEKQMEILSNDEKFAKEWQAAQSRCDNGRQDDGFIHCYGCINRETTVLCGDVTRCLEFCIFFEEDYGTNY